jgi:uncharacterized protein YydD (DUF2326 family)
MLVADRADASAQGDSRNSIGKTSFVKVLRYLLGGELPPEFKSPALSDHEFIAVLSLPAAGGDGEDVVRVSRAVSPAARVQVSGWTLVGRSSDMHVDDWRNLLSRHVFRIPADVTRPTPGQLWAQLIRTSFSNPVKGHATETDWETGVKIGFMLGLSPEILGIAGDVYRLNKQGKAIRAAVREGAIAHLSLDEPALRAQLAAARRQRDRTQTDLKSFRVDEQYSEHQQHADELTASIQKLNDEALALQRRSRELDETVRAEVVSRSDTELTTRLARVYAEIGLVLPDAVGRRYDEVQTFHESVVRNRRSFLEQELEMVQARLSALDSERRALDDQRSQILRLLRETVALDTFVAVQRDLASHEADVADLERRLEAANSISTINDTITLRTAELVASVRSEINERGDRLEHSISLFGALGAEIYTDRDASLLVTPTAKGLLGVDPHISGDASTGVRSVETFMFDMVCAIAAIEAGRAPRLLVHDSHLFDAIDGRQVASCLNIGARLAEEYGFEYIVTMNSDFLASVEDQSEGAFDSEPYMMNVRLTDESDSGGLFGFRFE